MAFFIEKSGPKRLIHCEKCDCFVKDIEVHNDMVHRDWASIMEADPWPLEAGMKNIPCNYSYHSNQW